MQKTLDSFFTRVNSVEETIPKAWKENPIPRAPVTPKRPVGRPKKRVEDEELEELAMIREMPSVVATPSPKRGKYANYSPKEKMDIMEEAELCGLRATALKWNLTPSTLSLWKKQDPNAHRHKSGRQVGGGRALTYDKDIEKEIVVWIQTQRERQLSVSRHSIRRYALALTKVNYPDFKASDGWLASFMKRNNFSLRSHTSLSQKLPADLEVRLAAFYQHLRELRIEHELDEDCLLLNMDEVPMVFDTVPSRTVHARGEKDVRVNTTGGEKKRFTAVLTVTAAGQYLPTMCVFKGKCEPKDVVLPKGWVLQMNDRAWVNEEVMIRWIREILRPYTQRRPALLVMDSFSAHITSKVKAELAKINTHPAIIPGGCTSKAQPLDVALNKPFKDRIRRQWTEFMQTRQEEDLQTDTGKTGRGPTRNELIQWMNVAQTDIASTLVTKSFKVTGISNALSGKEDDMVRDGSLLDSDDDDDDVEFDGFDCGDLYT